LWDDRKSGIIKLQLTRTLLQLRKKFPALFHHGEYIPVQVTGKFNKQILAFQRSYEKNTVIVVVPLNIAEIAESQETSPLSVDWYDTSVVVSNVSGRFRDLVSGEQVQINENSALSSLFRRFPIAVIKNE
jgi:maltooligosyltrehalose synthase